MTDAVIETQGLTKYYGKQLGVADLDLEVREGEVFGFLGPNGAGKTTTIRTLLDYIRPTRGQARIFGLDTRGDPIAIRARTGYLPGEPALYDKLTGREVLRYLANLRGGVDERYVNDLAERFRADLGRRIGTLSHGNRQKVALIQALMHRPDLLMLDEPTSGLDPLVQHQFDRLIEELRTEGRTIFLSSHILPEVEELCDRVGIIREGRLVAVETIETLKARAPRRLEIRFDGSVPGESFAGLPGVQDLVLSDGVLRCTVVGTLDAVIKTAARYTVLDVATQEPSLEDIFMAYYGADRAS